MHWCHVIGMTIATVQSAAPVQSRETTSVQVLNALPWMLMLIISALGWLIDKGVARRKTELVLELASRLTEQPFPPNRWLVLEHFGYEELLSKSKTTEYTFFFKGRRI